VSTWHGLQPIDTATNTPLKFIRLGVEAGSFASAPNGRTLYVLGSSNVIPISTATDTAGKAIGVPEQTGWEAMMIAVAPDGNICVVSTYVKPYVYDPFGTAGAMTVIPAGSRTPGKAIPIGGGPMQLVLAP
jgi:DNA-binding beta-propeller fold protein YncE